MLTCKHCGANIEALRMDAGGAYDGRAWAVVRCTECKKTFNVRGRDKSTISKVISLHLEELKRKRMAKGEAQ